LLRHDPDLTAVLITCGEDTEPECLRALGDVPLVEVRGVQPQAAASNLALRSCPTALMLQLDSDMVLYPGWRQRVAQRYWRHHQDPTWYQILWWLWDPLFERRILALKLVRPGLVPPYRDVRVPDIEHFERMRRLPARHIIPPEGEPIGEHLVRGPRRCYLKLKDDLLSVRRYHPAAARARAAELWQFFQAKYRRTPAEDLVWCLAGLLEGAECDPAAGSKRHDEEPLPHYVERARRSLSW